MSAHGAEVLRRWPACLPWRDGLPARLPACLRPCDLLGMCSACRVVARLRPAAAGVAPHDDAIDQAQPKMVKIYGAGGFRGLEAYQSGILISPEGHILTVLSHVLDTDYITVDARRRAEVRGQAAGRRSAAGGGRAEDRRQGPAALRPRPGGRGSRPAPACWPSATCSAWPPATSRSACSTGRFRSSRGWTPARGVVRDPLSRPGLRARRGDQQSRRGRRGAGHPARRTGGHAGQGTSQLAEQHLAELRRADRPVAQLGGGRSAPASSSPGRRAEAAKKPDAAA